MTTNISIYRDVIAEESLRYWKKGGKKNGARNLQIWDLFISLIDGCVLLCQLLLAMRFQGICTFSYTQGARNSIESQPKYYSIRRLLASSRSSNKLLIPIEEARAKPIPPRICWYILQFLGFEFDFSTRVFFFLFVHGLDIDSQRNFRFASRVPSRVSLEDDSRIVDFIALSTFTARRRSRGPQEVTNLLLDVKGREVCSSPSSVITIQSKNKIPVALSSSFTALSWSTVKLRWSISFFFKGHNTCSFGWLIFLHYRKIERGKKWKSSTRSKVEINLRLLVESKSCSLDRSISSLPRENEM